MNKIFRLFMICLTATAMFACNDDETSSDVTSSAVLQINEEDKNISFDTIGGSKTIDVTANTTFILEAGAANWLKVSDITSEAGMTHFNINVKRNATIGAREAKLVLKLAGVEDIEINVSQTGVPTFAANRRSVEFSSIANETSVFVNASKFTATVSSGANEWLNISVSDTTLKIRAKENLGSQSRSAAVTLHVDGYDDVVLNVTQEFYTPPTLSLSSQALEYTFLEAEQSITVNTNRPTYEVSTNVAWLSYGIAGSALNIKVRDNYGDVRTASVIVHVNGVADQVLTVTQLPIPEGSTPVLANRAGWVAQVEGTILDWGGSRPSGLLDGNLMTGWHAAADNPLPQTLVIDMKQPQIVTAVQLSNVPDAVANNWIYCQNIEVYLSEYAILPTDEAMKWGQPVAKYFWEPSKGNPFTIDLDTPIKGRYLILYFIDSREGNYISLTEVDVWVMQ